MHNGECIASPKLILIMCKYCAIGRYSRFFVNRVAMYEALLTHKSLSSSFLLVNSENLCDQLELEGNLQGELFHPRAKLQVAWIPIKIAAHRISLNYSKCNHTFMMAIYGYY